MSFPILLEGKREEGGRGCTQLWYGVSSSVINFIEWLVHCNFSLSLVMMGMLNIRKLIVLSVSTSFLSLVMMG